MSESVWKKARQALKVAIAALNNDWAGSGEPIDVAIEAALSAGQAAEAETRIDRRALDRQLAERTRELEAVIEERCRVSDALRRTERERDELNDRFEQYALRLAGVLTVLEGAPGPRPDAAGLAPYVASCPTFAAAWRLRDRAEAAESREAGLREAMKQVRIALARSCASTEDTDAADEVARAALAPPENRKCPTCGSPDPARHPAVPPPAESTPAPAQDLVCRCGHHRDDHWHWETVHGGSGSECFKKGCNCTAWRPAPAKEETP